MLLYLAELAKRFDDAGVRDTSIAKVLNVLTNKSWDNRKVRALLETEALFASSSQRSSVKRGAAGAGGGLPPPQGHR